MRVEEGVRVGGERARGVGGERLFGGGGTTI